MHPPPELAVSGREYAQLSPELSEIANGGGRDSRGSSPGRLPLVLRQGAAKLHSAFHFFLLSRRDRQLCVTGS
jgi:hypothetical protein